MYQSPVLTVPLVLMRQSLALTVPLVLMRQSLALTVLLVLVRQTAVAIQDQMQLSALMYQSPVPPVHLYHPANSQGFLKVPIP